jgi:hypothetical protein
MAILMFTYMPVYGTPTPEELITVMTIMYSVIGFLLLLVGILAIVGGAFCIRKKLWPLAIAGSIAGTITFFPCGIPAIIFTTLAKPEFDAENRPGTADEIQQ